jgi:CrcB protein
MSKLESYFWVALGSALGGVGRFWMSGAIAERIGSTFPWGTLLVNISGSFVIGVLAALTAPEGRLGLKFHPWVFHFLMMGVCGGYTTFSSFSLQTLTLAQGGEWLATMGNILASVALCLIGVWAGWVVGMLLNR